MKPFVTVVVTAYNRKDYLSEALASLENQTASREDFEVIVVKNFQDSAVDEKIARMGALNLYCESEYLPAFSSDAIKIARGEVISFLDDDDLFEKDKIRRVIDVFSSNPDVGYYHNSASFIDEKGEQIRAPYAFNFSAFRNPMGEIVVSRDSVRKSINKLIYFRHDFNRSCISVRKSILTERMDYARRIQSAHDSFIFYCAAMSGKSLFIDDRKLTRYRFNRKSVSLSSTYRFSRRQIKTYTLLHKMALEAGESEIANLLERQLLFFRTINAIHNPIGSRREVMRTALSFMKHANAYSRMANTFAGILSLTYIVSPGLSKKIYSKLTAPNVKLQ